MLVGAESTLVGAERTLVGEEGKTRQTELGGGGGSKKAMFAVRFIRPVKWSLRTRQQYEIHTGRSERESYSHRSAGHSILLKSRGA